jgi:hypothetical protein
MAFTASADLRASLGMGLSTEAGVGYTTLKYLDDVSKNTFTMGHGQRYGVRASETARNDVAVANRALTYTQTFEFVLTKGYSQTGMTDLNKYEAFDELHEIALRFYNRVIVTKGGLPGTVLNAINFFVQDPEFLEDKVAVLTGNIDIIYRLTL